MWEGTGTFLLSFIKDRNVPVSYFVTFYYTCNFEKTIFLNLEIQELHL